MNKKVKSRRANPPTSIMDTAQLRQEINHQLDQLSGDHLRLVADFTDYLAHKEQYERSTSSTADTQLPTNYRPPSGKSLLSHTETWAGDDFEECLQTATAKFRAGADIPGRCWSLLHQ